MMERFTRELTILPSLCDSSAALGVPDTFSLLQDIATEHACALGCGLDTIGPRGLFWLAVRTRVRFFRRPKMFERVTLTTWPERPGRLRADRDYLLLGRDGETLVTGKTEWTVLETASGTRRPAAAVFPPELAFRDETVWPEPYARMADTPLEEFARYAVRSVDIDLGGHMNNAAYVRALAGLYSCEAWQGMNIRELELAYRSPCHEGDTLIWQGREDGGVLSLRAALPDGKTVALGRLITG